ncbi:uncharacterized protein LOC113953525 [Corapipo altera]|uniref:uncharacterized protein LOC113953525 n=1 Tax=Corapipo altera TaxID=415028 RepID=UPI000FD67499|nr:uncharacterized protein LOC113953525 [Corapipo altera]
MAWLGATLRVLTQPFPSSLPAPAACSSRCQVLGSARGPGEVKCRMGTGATSSCRQGFSALWSLQKHGDHPLGLLPRERGGWGVLPLSSGCGDLGAFPGASSERCGVEVSEQELERIRVCRCHCCCSQLSSRFALQRAAGSKAADHGSSQQCHCCPVHPEIRVKSGIHLQLSQCIPEVRVATGSPREEETGKRSALPLEAAGFEPSPVTQFCS